MRRHLAATLFLLALAATAVAGRPGRDGVEPGKAGSVARRAGPLASNAPTTATSSRLTSAPVTLGGGPRLTSAPVTLLPPYNRGGLGAAAPLHESGYFKVRERGGAIPMPPAFFFALPSPSHAPPLPSHPSSTAPTTPTCFTCTLRAGARHRRTTPWCDEEEREGRRGPRG